MAYLVRRRAALALVLSFIFTAGGQRLSAAEAERTTAVLLITDESLAEAWRPLADWKTRLGKPTRVITVQSIEEDYKGADLQAKMRAACLDHIDRHSTRWVILGGDSQPGGKGLVPDRDTRHPQFRYDDLPADRYFISPLDWDANDDGVYGDFATDRDAVAYTHPSGATIGRIPVRTRADVAAYTEKVIAYESNYPASGFARRLVQTCPERMAHPKLATSSEQITDAWRGGKVMKFYHNRSPWDQTISGDHDLVPANWVAMINKKTAGKMHVHGHGLLPVWVLEHEQTVTADHVGRLTNRNAYLTMTTVSCFTGHYDGKEDPSITESMLRNPAGGAVVIIAPARQGVPVFHDPRNDLRKMVLEGKMDGTTESLTRFWRHALGRGLTAGEAWAEACKDMTPHARKTAGYHWALCELNLLGDPTLDLRAADPVTPKVSAPASIKTGRQTVTIKTDRPGATVCLWQGDDVYVVSTTDAQGQAKVEVQPKRAGSMLLTVTGPSLNAYTGVIEVR